MFGNSPLSTREYGNDGILSQGYDPSSFDPELNIFVPGEGSMGEMTDANTISDGDGGGTNISIDGDLSSDSY